MRALAFAPLVLMLAVLLFACGPDVPDPDYVKDSKPCLNKADQTTPCKAGKWTESQR